ncbi:MAG: hypothetical protein F4Y34_08395 [Gammaproteobacteria bacterium]|nr:hypothetical protein [Gammaproteobacteria bacterium]
MRLRILNPVEYDGQRYEPGEALTRCPQAMVDALTASGDAEDPDAPAPKPAAKPKKPAAGKGG